MIDQQIPRQPGQPYHEQSFSRSKALQILEHPQKNVLRQILRLGIAAGEPVADRVNPPGMQLDKVFPGGVLAAEAAFYELGICVQANARPRL